MGVPCGSYSRSSNLRCVRERLFASIMTELAITTIMIIFVDLYIGLRF